MHNVHNQSWAYFARQRPPAATPNTTTCDTFVTAPGVKNSVVLGGTSGSSRGKAEIGGGGGRTGREGGGGGGSAVNCNGRGECVGMVAVARGRLDGGATIQFQDAGLECVLKCIGLIERDAANVTRGIHRDQAIGREGFAKRGDIRVVGGGGAGGGRHPIAIRGPAPSGINIPGVAGGAGGQRGEEEEAGAEQIPMFGKRGICFHWVCVLWLVVLVADKGRAWVRREWQALATR